MKQKKTIARHISTRRTAQSSLLVDKGRLVVGDEFLNIKKIIEKYSSGRLSISKRSIAMTELFEELSNVNLSNAKKQEIAASLLKIGSGIVNLRGDEGQKIIRSIIANKIFEGIPTGKIEIIGQGVFIVKKATPASRGVKVVFNKKKGTNDTGPRVKFLKK